MIDVRVLLSDFDAIAQKLALKKVSPNTLNELKTLAQNYKTSKQDLEALQAEQNQKSKL